MSTLAAGCQSTLGRQSGTLGACRRAALLAPLRSARRSRGLLSLAAAVAAAVAAASAVAFVAAPFRLAPGPRSAGGDTWQAVSLLRAKQKSSATEVSPYLRKLKEEEEARKAAEEAEESEDPEEGSSKIIKKSLDEVLAAANDDEDRPNYLPMKRDIYKEVGITQAEVEAYWDRRDEASSNFADRLVGPGYVFLVIIFFVILWSIYDSIASPQENILASMTGTE